MIDDRRWVLRGTLIALLVLLLAVASLYAYRLQAPGSADGPAPFAVFAFVASVLLSLLPIALLVALVLLLARTLARSRGADRYEQLRTLADLRDRGVVTSDEFEREKRRILG